MPLFRLDKLIADTGRATRSEARELIRSGRVTVDGAVRTKPEEKFDGDVNAVCVDGNRLDYARCRYIMLDKPEGVLSACEDRRQKTVIDLLPEELRRQGLFPVGRLDKDTTGLLLLTNDGEFSHKITSPKSRIPKLYLAGVDRPMSSADAAAFREGLTLPDGMKCLPAELAPAGNGENRVYVTVFEGKFHQVKRMLAARGMTVLTLRRMSIGALRLDPSLGPGGYRELTEAEKVDLFCF